MVDSMYIGSGDVKALLAGKNTKGHLDLLRKFTSGHLPRYNSLHPNIPQQLRTGAILESVYYSTLPKGIYAPQYKVVSKEMDVLQARLDFGEIKGGKLIDFEEFKTEWKDTFDMLIEFRGNAKGALKFIKRYHPADYRQIQHQIYCSELDSGLMVRLRVDNYDDSRNRQRRIRSGELFKLRIQRDEEVISQIKERAQIFQNLRDYYCQD